MKHYLNPTKVMKSFVLAGAVSIGVFAGAHFTEAAGPDKVKVEHSVQVKAENPLKANGKEQHVPTAKPVVPAIPAEPVVKEQQKAEKASKSQASVHASENAKLHANPNSAVLGKIGKVEDEAAETAPVTEPAADVEETEVTPVQEPAAEENVDVNTDVTTDDQGTEAEVDTDDTAKTEDEAAVIEDEKAADVDSYSAEGIEDDQDADKDSDSKKVVRDHEGIVNTKDDEDSVSDEDDKDTDKDEKVNPSFANKVKSQAFEHASDNAKAHAAAISAVQAATVENNEAIVTDEVIAEDTTVKIATKE